MGKAKGKAVQADSPRVSATPRAAAKRDSLRVRAGISCLLASGILSVAGLHFRGPIVDQKSDPEAYVDNALLPTQPLAWAFLLPSLVLQPFGWLALWAFVRNTRHERAGFWGTVLSTAGNGFFLPAAGVIAFTSPAVGRLYRAGTKQAIDIADEGLAGRPALPFLMGSAALLVAGSFLHGLLLWRSPTLPRWTAVPYVWHALALTFVAPRSYAAERSGGVALLLTSAAITRAVWKGVAAAESIEG